MAKIHLAPFDPKRQFTVLRPFMCKGHQFDRGDKFDRTLVTTRSLKIHYELRAIGYLTEHRGLQPYPKPDVAVATDPMVEIDQDELTVASRPVLAAMARRAGLTVYRTTTRADLIDHLTKVQSHGAAHG